MTENSKFTLKALRVNKDLTQEEAAEKLGISKRSLQMYENGDRYPDIPTLKKIENLYGVEYRFIDFFLI